MTHQDIYDRFAAIIVNVTDIPVDEIAPDKSLADDLEIDSLCTVEIIMCIEEAFALTVPDEVMKTFVTVGDVVAHIEREVASAPAP